MNKKITILLALMVFSVMFVGGRAFAQMGWRTTEASELIGTAVYSPNGGYGLGQISDFVIDQTNGRVALFVLSDVPGFGSERIAIPFGALGKDFHINFPANVEGGYTHEWVTPDSPYAMAMTAGKVPAVIDADWVAQVYRQYNQAPYWTEEMGRPQMELYKSSTLIGAKVDFNQGGAAKIDDLVIDSRDGKIAFVTLTDVSGHMGDVFAAPYSLLSRKADNTFALNITEDKLASAPAFNPYENQGDRAYAENVYRHFGVQPYWTE